MYTDKSKYYEKIRTRVRKKRAFYVNFVLWIASSIFLLFVNLKTSPYHLWFIYPFLGWGLAVAFEAMEVFLSVQEPADEELEIELEITDSGAYQHPNNDDLSFQSENEVALELPELPRMWNEKEFV